MSIRGRLQAIERSFPEPAAVPTRREYARARQREEIRSMREALPTYEAIGLGNDFWPKNIRGLAYLEGYDTPEQRAQDLVIIEQGGTCYPDPPPTPNLDNEAMHAQYRQREGAVTEGIAEHLNDIRTQFGGLDAKEDREIWSEWLGWAYLKLGRIRFAQWCADQWDMPAEAIEGLVSAADRALFSLVGRQDFIPFLCSRGTGMEGKEAWELAAELEEGRTE